MTRKHSETKFTAPFSSKNKYFTLQLPENASPQLKEKKLATDGLQSIMESDLHNSKTLPKKQDALNSMNPNNL